MLLSALGIGGALIYLVPTVQEADFRKRVEAMNRAIPSEGRLQEVPPEWRQTMKELLVEWAEVSGWSRDGAYVLVPYRYTRIFPKEHMALLVREALLEVYPYNGVGQHYRTSTCGQQGVGSPEYANEICEFTFKLTYPR
jgi:hypothetical protein